MAVAQESHNPHHIFKMRKHLAALNQTSAEKEIELSFFEKKVLRKVSEGNRQKGIELANEICKSHRREGKFFDEILDDALKGDN